MPVTATHLTTAIDETDQASYSTASISPSANKLVLAWVWGSSNGPGGSTPVLSGAGMTWVEHATIQITGTIIRLSLFRAMSASPGSGVITIDFQGQTMLRAGWSFVEFGGVDTSGSNGAGAIQQHYTGETPTPGTSLSTFMNAFADPANATAAGFGVNANGSNIVPGTGFTQIGEANGTDSVMSMWRVDNDTTADASWTGSSLAAVLGVELDAAETGPPIFLMPTYSYRRG